MHGTHMSVLLLLLLCLPGTGAPLTTPQLLRRVLAGEMRLGEANALSFIATSYEVRSGSRQYAGADVASLASCSADAHVAVSELA